MFANRSTAIGTVARRGVVPTGPTLTGPALTGPALTSPTRVGSPSPARAISNQATLRHAGTALDPATRAGFERRFGVPLGNVRLHHDEQAARVASALQARAFTLGNDIVFATGAYAPQTDEGKATLAHELTHVVQHRGAAGGAAAGLAGGSLPAEREAEANAARSEDAALEVRQRIPAGSVHFQRVHMASGRFVGDLPGAENNLREEVLFVLNALAWINALPMVDYEVESSAVQSMPAATSVPVATIPKTIAGITAAETPVIDKVSANQKLGLHLTGAVGRAQPNAKRDVLALQDVLHGDWRIDNAAYATEHAAVVAAPGPPIADATIPKTLEGIGREKIGIVTGQVGEKYHHELAVSLKMGALAGQSATWIGSGPGSGNTFETWASAATKAAAGPLPAVATTTSINCWEMVLVAALQSRLIDWKWVHTLYTTSIGPGWGPHLVDTLTRGKRTPYLKGDPNTPRPNLGQVVFFDGESHVALANGIIDGVGRAQVWTFWPPPKTPFVSGGTIDKVKVSTIEELADFMIPIWGAPKVEFSLPPW